jgi:DNA-directed RNA polymerase subunit RPC12/RpoP
MTKRQKIVLKVVTAPGVGNIIDAPPVIHASDHTIDYTCGHCGELLMHAEVDQVHNLLIRCTKCGSYNSTDV